MPEWPFGALRWTIQSARCVVQAFFGPNFLRRVSCFYNFICFAMHCICVLGLVVFATFIISAARVVSGVTALTDQKYSLYN